MTEEIIFPSLFEDDYLVRSNSIILSNPVNALTELVANAWDAGATRVEIFIPEKIDDYLTIWDNGIGMTGADFKNHWMKLRYNRLIEQGNHVMLPDLQNHKRLTFGKNGIGRHGLLCFGPEYKVITAKDGIQHTFVVTSKIKGQPIAVIKDDVENATEHFTKLEVRVLQNRPDVDKIREILSSRFMQDPQFTIAVNNLVLTLENLSSVIDHTEICIQPHNIKLDGYFIDTLKSSRKSLYHGIAIWQGGRLVGEPSWLVAGESIVDGRSAFAKRYTFIFRTTDCANLVKEDWSGFIEDEITDLIFEKISNYVKGCYDRQYVLNAMMLKENLKDEIKTQLKKASPLVQYQVNEALEQIAVSKPTIRQEVLDVTVETLIKLGDSESGQTLLAKLLTLNSDDIEGLNQLLSTWSVKDALMVLNEIDRRLSIIEAISKLAEDKNTDELHILHPLITEARWLFGPEYESAEYIFNKTIKRAVDELFDGQGVVPLCTNPQKRPDLIIINNETSFCIRGVEDYTSNNGLARVTKLLVIELKKGGFKITRDERNQVLGYVEDLLKANILSDCQIRAFIVGESIADNVALNQEIMNGRGQIYVTDYSKLVDTANRRMMGLRTKLAERYDDVPGMELYKQLNIDFNKIKNG